MGHMIRVAPNGGLRQYPQRGTTVLSIYVSLFSFLNYLGVVFFLQITAFVTLIVQTVLLKPTPAYMLRTVHLQHWPWGHWPSYELCPYCHLLHEVTLSQGQQFHPQWGCHPPLNAPSGSSPSHLWLVCSPYLQRQNIHNISVSNI